MAYCTLDLRLSVLPVPDNPSLLSHVPVTVQVLDVNDNPPEVATDEEVIVCESSRPGQVSLTINVSLSSHLCKESDESCARTWAGFSTLSGIRSERLFPFVWVVSSELSIETRRSLLKTV